jgi:phage-related protein
MKPLRFVGSSLDDLSTFPIAARREAGYELWQVQMGLAPRDFKSMSTVGHGCHELRIHMAGEWRVIYVAKFEEAIYVLHAFHKKSRATSDRDLQLARKRYLELRG